MTSIITASAEVLACQPANYAIIFAIFFLPHTYTPSLRKAAPQAAATHSVLERQSPFLCPLPGGQRLSMPFPAVPRHCTVMLLLDRRMAQGCSSSFVHLMFIGATTQGEVTSGAPSSHFAFMGSEVHGQEESQAAPVTVARCRTVTGAGVTARAGGGGSHILV